MRIGIDIGRVIIGPTIAGTADTRFIGTTSDEAMQTPPADGAFEAIAALVRRTAGRVWLVSKAGPSVERKTTRWLGHHGFHEATGVPSTHVRFCRERHEKVGHARELALTHFVDDRRDVLQHLRGVVPSLFLFGEQEAPCPGWATPLPSWRDALARLG